MQSDIQSRIEKSREEILAFAARMISFQTPDPPAHNTREIQDWMTGELEKLGMKTECLDLYPDELSTELLCRHHRCTRAEEWVEDELLVLGM